MIARCLSSAQTAQMTNGHGSLAGHFRPPQVEFVPILGSLGAIFHHDDLPKLSSEPALYTGYYVSAATLRGKRYRPVICTHPAGGRPGSVGTSRR